MLLTSLGSRLAAAIMLFSATLSSAAYSQLSLRDAFAEADRAGFANRTAAANVDAQRGQALEPFEGIAPKLHLDAGYVRTTDPIGVFGATLRQRAITTANFDVARLNNPDALGNYQAAIVVEQPIWNADAWAARRAGASSTEASREAREWSRLSTRVDVVRAYYGVVLADERVAALRAASQAAHAHVADAASMVRQGLATKSDALLAAVRAGDIDSQLAEGTAATSTSRRQLAILLGRDGTDARLQIAAVCMPSTQMIQRAIAADTMAIPARMRADVRATSDALAAAREDALRAKTSLVPRVNGFARYDWNSPTSLYRGDKNWTIGVMASWSPFSDAGALADIETTSGRARAAAAQADAARANARAEVEDTRAMLVVALARLEIAERAVEQSVEAHRIVSRKYGGGMATVVELLEAQAVETQSVLALAQARYAVIVTAAERRRAVGLDPASLAMLDAQ